MTPLVLFAALSAYAADPTVILGVLEEVPGHYAGEPLSRVVRVAFQKDGREWKAFPASCPDQECLRMIASKFPVEMTWNISFSGRSLGPVPGTALKEVEFYSDIGIEKLEGPAPSIGRRSAEFGGFLGKPVLRPLIANSQPFYKDPDSWKPSQTSAEVAASLRSAFRKKFPDVSNCKSGKPWKYRDADISIRKTYSSSKGWSVAQLQLPVSDCEGPPDDAFLDQWFAVSPGREVMFIGSGMWLVDAGDYDGDGASELVFAIDRYNEGGYELFYGGFKGHATFAFSYH